MCYTVVLAVWQRAFRTPAGDNTYFYKAKEVLTDKEGRFEIPSYRPINLLPLLSYIRGPHFTVFKPGYLSLPEIDLSDYLLKGANKSSVELPEKGEVVRLAPGIIELPKLKTREERRKLFPGLLMYDEANKKAKNYMRLLNVEAKEIGIDPYPIEEGGRK